MSASAAAFARRTPDGSAPTASDTCRAARVPTFWTDTRTGTCSPTRLKASSARAPFTTRSAGISGSSLTSDADETCAASITRFVQETTPLQSESAARSR